MGDFDLIPSAYRQRLRVRAGVRAVGISIVLLVALLGIGRTSLNRMLDGREQQVARLRAQKGDVLHQKARLESLQAEKVDLLRRQAILSGLRGGVEARRMFLVVDQALDGNVWFLSWTFRRAGELVEQEPETVDTGYFIVVPSRAKDEPQKAWRLEVHMEIHARALDHATLAEFVRRLVEQPEVRDVRILQTRVHDYTARQVVDFELAVIVNPKV